MHIFYILELQWTQLESESVFGGRQWLLLMRGGVGAGLGGLPVAYTLFMEWVPGGARGRWLVVLQAFWTIGSMAEAGLAWWLLSTWGWRALLTLSAIPLGAPPSL